MHGYVETLSDLKGNSAMANKAYQEMSNQIDRMKDLADDIILLSTLESDRQLPQQPINLHKLLSEILLEAEQISGGKHRLTLEGESEIEIKADTKLVRSALGNIVFNAVLHNPKGADISIAISETSQQIEVAIKDAGVGIDPDEIPRLTERFYRGDSSRNSKTGGSGLGLAIVKHALTKCGATLDIKSRLGQGALFICIFPK
jgi:two-component system phosphate regulon sensor histidine kinase PhoR